MKAILQKLLQKRGIESLEELSEEEKSTFNEWDKILSKESLDINDIKLFCENQVTIIESKWSDYEERNDKKAELIPYHTVYRTLLNILTSPIATREALERQLTELTK